MWGVRGSEDSITKNTRPSEREERKSGAGRRSRSRRQR